MQESTTTPIQSAIPLPEITVTSPTISEGGSEDNFNSQSPPSPLLVSKVDRNLRRSVTGHLFHLIYMFIIVSSTFIGEMYFLIPVIITSILLLVPYFKLKVGGKTLSIGGESWMSRVMHIITALATISYVVYVVINGEGNDKQIIRCLSPSIKFRIREEVENYLTILIANLIAILLSSISAMLPLKSGMARYMSLFYEKVKREKVYGLTRSFTGTLLWLGIIVAYLLSYDERKKNGIPICLGSIICFIMTMPGVSSNPKLRFLLPIMNLLLSFSCGDMILKRMDRYDDEVIRPIPKIMALRVASIIGAIACSYLPLSSRSAIWYSPIYNKVSREDRKKLKNDLGFTFKIESLFGVLSSILILGMTLLIDDVVFIFSLSIYLLILIPHAKNLYLANYRAIRFFLCGREGMKLKRGVCGTIYSLILTVILCILFIYCYIGIENNSRQICTSNGYLNMFIFWSAGIMITMVQNARVAIDQRIRGSIPIIYTSLMAIFSIMNYKVLLLERIYSPFLISIVLAILILFPSYHSLESKLVSWIQPLHRASVGEEEDFENNL